MSDLTNPLSADSEPSLNDLVEMVAARVEQRSQALDSDLTIFAELDASTEIAPASDGAGWVGKSAAQFKTWLGLAKADVGLGSADNTADTAKPISTAAQTALDLKAARWTELYQSFSGTGALGDADSGQEWQLHDNGDSGAALSCIDGYATNTAATTDGGAGYADVDMEGEVYGIAAEVALTAYSASGGSAALVAWSESLTDNPNTPDAPMHFWFNTEEWGFNVVEDGVVSTALKSGTFNPTLTADGATLHKLMMWRVGTTVYMFLPDGNFVSVTDARIASLSGQHACIEVYQSNATTQTKAKFKRVWASIAAALPYDLVASGLHGADVAARAARANLPIATHFAPGSPVATPAGTFPTFANMAAAFNLEFTAPPSGRVFVEVEAYIEMTADDWVIFNVTGGTTSQTTVTQKAVDGLVKASFVMTGLTPGANVTTYPQLAVVSPSGTTNFVADTSTGKFAKLVVTPLPSA